MPNEKSVGHYVTLQRGITYKGNLVGKPGPALLGLGAIHPGGGFREGDYKTYGGECPPKLLLYPGDLFVSLKGATKDGKMIGSIARVPRSVQSGRLTQDTVKLEFRQQSTRISNYLYWLLRTPQYRDYCEGRATGSAVVALSREDFLSYPVPQLTRTREQVVNILEAIEAKIELNRRMNETLEAMARALFKDWFVDFGPVRAKAEGRQPPGLSPEIAALFPDALDDEDKPAGWLYRPFGKLLKGSIGGDWGADVPDNGNSQPICVIRGTDLPDIAAGGKGKVPTRYTTPKKAAGRTLTDRDIVIEVSGGSPTQPTGRSLLITQAILDRFPHPVVCASFCRRFRPNNFAEGIFASQHLAFLYDSGGTWEYQNQSTGISNFQTTHFLDAENVVWPCEAIIKQFSTIVEPLIRLSTRNENQTLSELRDLLLPKLMSGEIRLQEAEQAVEAVL